MPMCQRPVKPAKLKPKPKYPRPVYLPQTQPVKQTKPMSAIEATTNATVGFLVSWSFTFWGLPLFGIEPDAIQATWITASYFFLSALRTYAIRRAFNF